MKGTIHLTATHLFVLGLPSDQNLEDVADWVSPHGWHCFPGDLARVSVQLDQSGGWQWGESESPQ